MVADDHIYTPNTLENIIDFIGVEVGRTWYNNFLHLYRTACLWSHRFRARLLLHDALCLGSIRDGGAPMCTLQATPSLNSRT